MRMNQRWLSTCVVLAVASLGACCAPDRMTVAGAAVGGPVGAVVGAGVGAYAGNVAAGGPAASGGDAKVTTSARYESTTVRSVQQALNDRGFSVGPADGQWGPSTEDGVRRFQAAAGLPVTGNADSQTLNALGVR